MRRWISNRASASPADVDEVAQEVFLRLLRYSDEALAESPQDHLFRIAASVTDEWQQRDDSNDAPGSLLLYDEREIAAGSLADEHVRAVVESLPQQQREALLLHVNEDLTYRQVAIRMQLTPSAAQRDIVSAYVNLRYQLLPPSWM
jgi:RNA polymerase sigma-70 factor (ECF subfamily)